MNSSKFAVAITAAIASTTALAHPGHSHGESTSMLTHVMFYGSIVAGIAIVAFAGYQVLKKSSK